MTETVDIVVKLTGAEPATTGVRDLGTAAKETAEKLDGQAKSTDFLKGVSDQLNSVMGFLKISIAGIAVGEVVNKYRELSDTFTGMINRLKLVSTSAADLVNTERLLLESANRTRGSFEDSTNLYTKLAIQSGALGIEQKSLIPTIETINQLIAVSGASAIEAKNGLLQFSQGLASNRFQGQDLRAVLEDLPALGQAIAKGLGVTIGELRVLGEEGKLTAKDVLAAIDKQAPEIQKKFATLVPTMAQAMQVIKNNILQLVGTFDQLNNGGSRVAAILLTVGNNIIVFARAIGVAAATVAAFYVGLAVQSGWNAFVAGVSAANIRLQAYVASAAAAGIETTVLSRAMVAFQSPISTISGLFQALWGVIRANPLGALITIIGAVVAGFYFFGQSVKLNADGSITALGAVVGIANLLLAGLQKLGGYVSTALGPIFHVLGQIITTTFNVALQGLQALLGFLAQFIPALEGSSGRLGQLSATITQAMKEATASMQGATLANKDFGNGFANSADQVSHGADTITKGVHMVGDSLTQMGRVNAAAIPPFENLLILAERSKETMARAAEQFKKYCEEVDKSAAATQALALTTRNAMGDMVASTDEWARRSGADFNSVKGIVDGVTTSLEKMAEEAAAAATATAGVGASGSRSSGGYSSGSSGGELHSFASGGLAGGGPGPDIQGHKTKWNPSGSELLIDWKDDGHFTKDTRPWTNSVSISGFATGGAFDVGGTGGTDSQLVQFMASPNERVTIETPSQRKDRLDGQSSAPSRTVVVNMSVRTPDANSFRRSKNQTLLELKSKLNGVGR